MSATKRSAFSSKGRQGGRCSLAFGAKPSSRGTAFSVWAPHAETLSLKVFAPSPGAFPMRRGEHGFWKAFIPGLKPGALYKYILNGEERPDPASASQPEGVHGPSEVVDHAAFRWSDRSWKGLRLEDMVIYELHPGTFTPRGGFAGVEEKISYLKELGVNAVELMPVAQFPGPRNWGYDGAYLYAAQNSYGGAEGLKRLVDACHGAGLAVILDVVYNHLGPEGSYLGCYGPCFTDRYRTPWGDAVNYDGPGSLPVREFFIGNALYWLREFHIDALRLDAVHGIFDFGAKHFLADMQERAEALSRETGRRLHLIAESDLNDPRLVTSPSKGGYGLAGQWSDDFHHSLHSLLTGEKHGYYEDFGGLERLAKAMSDSFVYDWEFSTHRRRMFGAPAGHVHPGKFVVCSQNHDQVGNRLGGERLASLVNEHRLKLAAGAVLLSPYVPMLFMGEEYAETNPFQYFVSHGDPGLVAAVREGRKREFAAFGWKTEPPDPQGEETFAASSLDWDRQGRGMHARLLDFYRRLIALRRSIPSLGVVPRSALRVGQKPPGLLSLLRVHGRSSTFTVFNFGRSRVNASLPAGRWRLIFSSEEGCSHAGGLPPESFAVFARSSK